jgi:hypothetical protein
LQVPLLQLCDVQSPLSLQWLPFWQFGEHAGAEHIPPVHT